jgi:hypothetical protein
MKNEMGKCVVCMIIVNKSENKSNFVFDIKVQVCLGLGSGCKHLGAMGNIECFWRGSSSKSEAVSLQCQCNRIDGNFSTFTVTIVTYYI